MVYDVRFKATLGWFGNARMREIEDALMEGLEEAGEFLAGKIEQKLSRIQGHRGKHSKPGQAPFMQSGRLAGSVHVTTNRREKRVRVASRQLHAGFLEKGTSKMAPRPAWKRERLRWRNHMKRIVIRKVRNRTGI